MINLILLNILIFSFGYFFIEIVAGKNLNLLEKLGIAIGGGYALITILLLPVSLLGIRTTFYNVVLLLALGLGVELFIIYRKGNLVGAVEDLIKEARVILIARHSILDWLLILVIIMMVTTQFYKSLGFAFDSWDEYSYWGMAAKIIYTGKSVILSNTGLLPGFEKYPIFLPTASALNNIAIGNFGQNFARLINPIILGGLILFLTGYLKRIKLKKTEVFLFILLLLSSGSVFSQMSAILYADLAMAYFYTIAISIYLINFIEKPRKEYYIISAIFFTFTAWSKIDGLQTSLITISILMIFDFFFIDKKIIRKAMIKGFLLYSIVLIAPLFWYLFGKFIGLQNIRNKYLFSNLNEKIADLKIIVTNMYFQVVLSNAWPLFWMIVLLSTIIGLVFFIKKIPIVIMSSIILVNLMFMLLAYILVFSINESIIASSFGRYIIRIFPISLVFVAYLYNELKEVYEKGIPPAKNNIK